MERERERERAMMEGGGRGDRGGPWSPQNKEKKISKKKKSKF
jgi:hypothetical protein